MALVMAKACCGRCHTHERDNAIWLHEVPLIISDGLDQTNDYASASTYER